MNKDYNTPLFRLWNVTREPAGISCSVSIHGNRHGDTDSQRLVYHERDSTINFETPEAAFTSVLREHEGMLKKILSICVKTSCPGDIDLPFVFPERFRKDPVPENAIQVFTDGSLAKSGIGGWAGIIQYPMGAIVEKTGREPHSTSNRTELLAVVKTLASIESDGPAVVRTDSRYVIRGADVWLVNWERNGFFTAQNRPVKNRDLWESFSEIMKKREIHFQWLPSSCEEALHRRCDLLARAMTLSPA